ncbi:MAG: monofunctional biosynthetic peptidoglycan transglycosylase [Bacteroidetes bacterium]|jgi:monofunctional biosynthetic peptidoglycan transglycosylase|nr:monofunctional biosynthetic peptidoglycan transglycosylase [Bacteroidota bacterium]
MLQKIWRFTWKAALWFFGISIFSVIVFRFVPVPVTILMLQRCVEQKIDGEPMVMQKDWVSLDKISNNLQLAVVTSEDQQFLWHHGFDFEAIEKAQKYNEKQKKRKRPKTRGASTISQQTAKNVFLFPQRSYIRKGLEVYFTALIELLWSKQRIMEVYLNVIEMGDGIYGAEAAAQYYFHKPASKLTAAEAAGIAACLPNPRKYHPKRMPAQQARILNQMRMWGGKLDYNMPPFDEE